MSALLAGVGERRVGALTEEEGHSRMIAREDTVEVRIEIVPAMVALSHGASYRKIGLLQGKKV
jgi:hypothetical protein